MSTQPLPPERIEADPVAPGEAPAALPAQLQGLMQELIDGIMRRGAEHHRRGEFGEAEDCYRLVLREQPRHADANHNLGVIAVELGQPRAAVPFFAAACEAQPGEAQYWVSQADALMQAGLPWDTALVLEDARAAGLPAAAIDELMERLMALPQPVVAEGPGPDALAIVALTQALNARRFDDLVALATPLCDRHPDNPLPWRMLALGCQSPQRELQALPARLRLAQLCPDDVENLNALGLALTNQGRLADAEYAFRRILGLQPDHVSGLSNLGLVLQRRRRLPGAEAVLRRCIALAPGFAIAHLNLSVVLDELARPEEAERSVREALRIDPGFVQAHNSLGFLLKDQGRVADAIASTERALQLDPRNPHVHSNLLFLLNYDADRPAEAIFAAYRRFDEQLGLPQRAAWRAHPNDRNAARRLRVGYVSPSFSHHSTRFFLEPLLAHHDHERFEVVAYAELASAPDATTRRYQGCFDHWVLTNGMSDEELAERVRADGIDILVDIAGHTRGNRLEMFARKPAPVSLHWLDFGYTTGVSAIDWYLTDAASAPPGSDHLFAEKPWRLPGPALVYRPGEGMGEPGPLPALRNGRVTFGTLTRAIRINHHTVRAWSRILARVPDSVLVIDSANFAEAGACEAMAARFVAQGIARERLHIGCHSPPWDVLRGIDIGLDCHPHNSGTTLFEMLYMGVPYVTLPGRPSVGRLGEAILRGLGGRAAWIGRTEDAYVEAAVALASDIDALARTRASLRADMQRSALMDEPAFARQVEAAYREMFRLWSAKAEA